MPEKCELNPNVDCPNSTKMALLEHRVESLEEGQKREGKFREDYYQAQRDRIKRDTELDAKISGIDANVSKLVQRQEEEDNKPNKLLDKLKDRAWEYVLVLVLAYIAVRLGLSA